MSSVTVASSSWSLVVCRCKTCGEYIYKGKKFNARKETVQNELYMGLPIFRFYIKCTRCLAEITFKVSVYNALIISVIIAAMRQNKYSNFSLFHISYLID